MTQLKKSNPPSPCKFKKGQRVQWKAAGKVARLEGMHGKIATGTVTSVYYDSGMKEWTVSVAADHRKTGSFKGMGAAISEGDVSLVTKKGRAA